MSGWYVMHRGWMDSFKPEPFTEREAFLWSIEQAAFQDHDQWFNGHRIAVGRGEFVTSLRDMEKAFGWSLKRIRGFMERMGRCEKWTQRRAYEGAQSPTVVSVCNYDVYQTITEVKGTVGGTVKGTRRAQSGHSEGTQQKEGNKGNNRKEEGPTVSSAKPTGDEPEVPAIDRGRQLAIPPAPDPADAAFAAFEATRREISPGSRPIDLSPDRRKKLALRLGEIGGVEPWNDILAAIRGSPFLRGETSRTGRPVATIDWLLKPENLRKVREGNYDERSGSPGHRATHSATPIDAMREARAALGFGGP